ncbi:hypothetical protein GCM10009555_092310 [Acrocarpospora macrocephala]|uniref:Uncharacterized protein n=1 Tax=Acrocarpospora macrocephala TaxID=150177 RepID=A0A5M3X0P0_9ACTN|nr:hypothetical protein [Acrocarpospora macrocephala]GES14694.1 hypothetical protein Amac_082910 [Acrocarpospora macrocephala]
MRTLKRATAALATTAVAITTFAVLTGPAQARPNEWYPCKIDGRWYWCMDL